MLGNPGAMLANFHMLEWDCKGLLKVILFPTLFCHTLLISIIPTLTPHPALHLPWLSPWDPFKGAWLGQGKPISTTETQLQPDLTTSNCQLPSLIGLIFSNSMSSVFLYIVTASEIQRKLIYIDRIANSAFCYKG